MHQYYLYLHLLGQRLENIYELINKVKENTVREIKTSDINRVIEESVALSQPWYTIRNRATYIYIICKHKRLIPFLIPKIYYE